MGPMGAGPGTPAGPRVAPVKMVQWTTSATTHRSKLGSRVIVGCPSGGQLKPVWGTGIYTDDSSICSAAVHAGLITVAAGGVVTLEIAAGRASYNGSVQHGVSSGNWGQYNGSYIFIGSARPLPRLSPRRPLVAKTITWNQTARHLRTRVGQRFSFLCPRGGRFHTVWGSSIYTDDSSICGAAVHAGYITLSSGGKVTLEIQSGQAAYQGSHRNGVKSASWRSWSGSFIFVVPMSPPSP